MADLKKIVYLTEAQKEELFTNNTVTANGVTVTFNADDLYVTSDNVSAPIVDGNGIHRKVWATQNATVPTGATAGDIVLVESNNVQTGISSAVEDISSAVTLNYGYDPLQKWIYVHDGIVDMFIETYFANYVADNEYIIGTIASPYRPNHLIVTTGHTTDSNFNPRGLVNFIVYTNGNLSVRVNNTNGNYVIVHATYPMQFAL